MNKDIRPIEDIFNECCEKVFFGTPIEEAISYYPNYANELRKLLGVVEEMRNTLPLQVSEQKMVICLIRVGQEIERQKEQSLSASLNKLFFFPSADWARGFALALTFIFIAWGTINVSASSIPGDPLYLVKLITERVKYFLTINPESQIELKIVFSERRSKELVDKFYKDGQIDVGTLKAMLNEAGASLGAVAKLPVGEQKIYLTKLEYLNAYQKDVLQGLRGKASESQKPKLDEAICTCNQRDQLFQRARNHGSIRGLLSLQL